MKFSKIFELKPIDTLKFVGLLVATTVARIIPLPMPNVEPIMAVTMPASKNWGALGAALFAALALAAKDFVQMRVGLWTLFGALAYAGVAFLSYRMLTASKKQKAPSRWEYAKTAAVGTLAFDLVTGLLFGWQFGQTLTQTLVGQIPFTLYHLAGNLLLGVTLSPALFTFLQPRATVAPHAQTSLDA